ncbi:MAG: TolC family protein [Microscillaceae bacterium]|nr:TolC family protein [Microscillaceae bacterium]MDW8461943.1 TolC family protein [Cytophagales bacterium]
MKKKIFFLVWVMLSCPKDLLWAQNELKLSEAIAYAIQNNYSLKVAKSQVQIEQNNNTLGNAGFLPTLTSITVFNGRSENVKQKFISGNTNERNAAATRNFNTTLNLNWTIYDGGLMFVNRQRLGLITDISENILKDQIENTIFQVCLAYYNIIQQKQRLKSLENNLLISQQRLDLAKSKYEIGTGSKVEFLNAQVDFNTDKSAILSQKQQIVNAKIALNTLIVRPLETDFEINDSLVLAPKLTWETLWNEAKTNNISLKTTQMQRQMSELNLRATQALRLPQVDLNANGSFNYLTSQAGFLVSSRNFGVGYGLTATFNIFNGFNQNRLEQNAKLQILMQDQQLKNQTLNLESQLLQIFKHYENVILLAQLEKENLEIARQNVAIALERYKVGASTPLELREVQRNVITTESRLIEALFNAKVAELNLLRLSGGLIQKNF